MNKRTTQEDIMTLMYQVMRQMRKRMDTSEAEHVNPYKLHALFAMSHGPITMSELAEEMSISLPSATSLVNRLVDHGWVKRDQDDKDRRVIRLDLTDSG